LAFQFTVDLSDFTTRCSLRLANKVAP